jgi:hypothetical protein
MSRLEMEEERHPFIVIGIALVVAVDGRCRRTVVAANKAMTVHGGKVERKKIVQKVSATGKIQAQDSRSRSAPM